MTSLEKSKLLITELSALEILGLFHSGIKFQKANNISTFESLQEILDMIRLNTKYLLLDDESLHREKKNLQDQLLRNKD